MKILVFLCLLVLAASEDDSQEQTQSSESTPGAKPTLAPQTGSAYSAPFPPSSLNFGNKDTAGNVPFTGFTFPNIQGNTDFFPSNQGASAFPNFSQGGSNTPLASLPQNAINGQLQNFPQGIVNSGITSLPQGAVNGALPNFPQGIINGALPNFPQGVVNGALPNFSQGVVSTIPNFTPAPRTIFQSAPAVGHGIQSSFNLPGSQAYPSHVHNAHVYPSHVRPVVNGLGHHYTGYTAGTYPAFHGSQSVPAGSFSGNTGNVGLTYRVLPQEAFTNFPNQGLQHQSVPATAGSLPPFTGGILSPVPNGVFTPSQGIIKTPITGTTHSLNLPTLNIPSGNIQSEPSTNVFRQS